MGETVERRSFGDFGRLTYWPRRRPDIASRVQELADPTAILATKSIVNAAEAAGLVGAGGYRTSSRQLPLRGVSEAFTIYEIRERALAAAAA